jgi:sugar fermentation stimulation protein A
MRFPKLYPATVVDRYKRFKLLVNKDGVNTWAYLPNPGRLRELIYPGAPVWLKKVSGPHRTLKWEAVLGYDSVFVCLYAALANKLFMEGMGLLGINDPVRPEVVNGMSRFDFLVGDRFVEIKSVTLVQEGLGLFPDAPTKRGSKHLQELGSLGNGMVVFVVQRCDAEAVTFHSAMDPEFAQSMVWAKSRGVQFRAMNCLVTKEEIRPWQEIPVLFPQG